jgi:hypothetical protein
MIAAFIPPESAMVNRRQNYRTASQPKGSRTAVRSNGTGQSRGQNYRIEIVLGDSLVPNW